MKDSLTPKKYGLNNLTVIYGLDISVDLIDACIKQIDTIYYPNSTTSSEAIKSWVFEHPQFCFILQENTTKKVVGYLYCFPMTEKATLEFLQGKSRFKNLKLEDMDDFISEGIYNLFVASLAVIDKYHKKDVRRLLFECFLNQAIAFAKRDMFINYIFMEIASDYEQEICRLFNIEKLTTNIAKREIYGGMFDLRRFIHLDNYLAVEAVYDTKHANNILKFRRNYTQMIKNKKTKTK